MNRLLFRALLVGASFMAFIAILDAFVDIGLGNPGALAGALAVIAAVVSARASTQVLELQEDAQLPHPYPYVDASSRYQLLQLRVENSGGTAAHSGRLEWDKPLLGRQGNHVGCRELPVLMPQHSIAEIIDVDHAFFDREQDANYSGKILFRDARGNKHQYSFRVGAEQYRMATSYDDEIQKTYYKLQQIPEHLRRLNRELAALRRTLRDR